MAQYKTGTVTVTNGSTGVVGVGTLFAANVTVGDWFIRKGDDVSYQVATVTNDTNLVLASSYQGTNAGGVAYSVTKDFTANFNIPLLSRGDIDTATVFARAMSEIDIAIGQNTGEWLDFNKTPTFVDADTFTLVGDQTGEYHVGRRLKIVDSSTLYGIITSSVFTSLTTIDVTLDTGSITGAIATVQLGIVTADGNQSVSGSGIKGGTPEVDTIAENTAATGVTVDGVLHKDGLVSTGTPTTGTHAANKSYVDALVVSGVFWKQPVRVASTANLTLSGEQTIDAVATSADRILVKDQSAGAENGIYVTAAGAWARSVDADEDAEVIAGIAVVVAEGTAGGDKAFILTTDDPITVGATALTFAQFSGGGGDTLPIDDGTAVVKGSADPTKLLRLEVDGLTGGVTRVWTAPDQDLDLTPGQDFANEAGPATHSTLGITDTFSGNDNEMNRVNLKDHGFVINALGDLGGGTDDLAFTSGNFITCLVSTGAQTFTFSGWAASGTAMVNTIVIENGESQGAITWPGAMVWITNGGNQPILKTSGKDIVTLMSVDGGTTVYGWSTGVSSESITQTHAKVGATSGWLIDGADDLGLLATLPAAETGTSTLIVPLNGLKVGQTITAFSLIGQIESAGETVIIDADLRKHTAAAGDVADASVATMTQISKTADYLINDTKSGLTEVIQIGETFFILITGTTGASASDIAMQGVTVTVTEG